MKEINIINDQFGKPTSADELAKSIWAMTSKLILKNNEYFGIFHFCNSGDIVSWYEFSKYIFQKNIYFPDLNPKIKPISLKEYASKAIRPYWSVLNCNKIKNIYGISVKNWKESVDETITEKLIQKIIS